MEMISNCFNLTILMVLIFKSLVYTLTTNKKKREKNLTAEQIQRIHNFLLVYTNATE